MGVRQEAEGDAVPGLSCHLWVVEIAATKPTLSSLGTGMRQIYRQERWCRLAQTPLITCPSGCVTGTLQKAEYSPEDVLRTPIQPATGVPTIWMHIDGGARSGRSVAMVQMETEMEDSRWTRRPPPTNNCHLVTVLKRSIVGVGCCRMPSRMYPIPITQSL